MKLEDIINIAQKRGFFYPSAEIYDAIAGFWNYGPVGYLLKRKIENEWRKFFIKDKYYKQGDKNPPPTLIRTRCFEMQGTDIMPEDVFNASGHIKSFADPLTQCKKCKSMFRTDKLIEDKLNIFVPERTTEKKFDEIIKKNKIKCPNCSGELTKTRYFNMMFKLDVGPTEQAKTAYLRPETCQAIFTDFQKIYKIMRAHLPLGIAQIGRAFRNEISPRRTLLRQREFTQAELEVFFDPEKIDDFPEFETIKNEKIRIQMENEEQPKEITVEHAVEKNLIKAKLFAYYLARIYQFINILGIKNESIRLREQTKDERPFYASQAFDCEVETLTGWTEIVANHYRTDHDISSHMKVSKKDLRVLEDGKKITPHVWEVSQGIDRTVFCVLVHCYREDERGWSWFAFPPEISPYAAGVFPLVNKNGLPAKAKEVYKILEDFDVFYDDKGSIGRRYARADEIGTPFGITIDNQTLEDNTITIRNRDNCKQIRILIKDLVDIISKLISGKMKFEEIEK